MTGEECYAVWAPEDSIWSPWVRPVLFAQLDQLAVESAAPSSTAAASAEPPEPLSNTAVVVELEGAEAVRVGVQLARSGFRPVPLFNGTHGPEPLIDVRPIAAELITGARTLPALHLPPDAPPAFLLDATRMQPTPLPGRYDNRWVVLPQDFPSGTFLRSRGIEHVLLLQQGVREPRQDLAHVLLRWQDAGLRIGGVDSVIEGPAHALELKPPPWFRRAWYTVIALAGLRRSNVGGFGAVVPEQTSSGSGFA